MILVCCCCFRTCHLSVQVFPNNFDGHLYSGPHDASVKEPWPKQGGADGSIRFDPEIKHGANAGLSGAVSLLEPVKKEFPDVSYADIYQMASARAIELAGGPKM